MKDALDKLRAKLPSGESIDYAELVRIGAEAKLRRLGDEESTKRAELKRVADMIRAKSFPWKSDVTAADEVKHLRLIPKYE